MRFKETQTKLMGRFMIIIVVCAIALTIFSCGSISPKYLHNVSVDAGAERINEKQTWIYRGMYLEKSNKLPLKAYIKVPTGIAAFPDPVFAPTPKSIIEYNYNVVHWSTMEKGGHFAAFEEPDVLYLDFKKFISKIA